MMKSLIKKSSSGLPLVLLSNLLLALISTCVFAQAANAQAANAQAANAQAANAQAANVSTAKREVLVESTHSWNGTEYSHYPSGVPQLTVLRLTIAPHSALPWHTHPFPNTGYVLSGELTIQDRESGQSVTYHEGQAFAESVERVHRGITGDIPTILIITYAGVTGTPTSIPVKGELPEY